MTAKLNPMRTEVLMVSGAYPPDVCGVGDYTARLMQAAPSNWALFVESDWSWRRTFGIVRRLLARRPDCVVIQYPTQGYGWSLVPHLLILIGRLTGRYRTVLVLHEFSSLSGKSQTALSLASHAATHIIFTTEVERERAFQSRLFASTVPTSVIPILSNIPQNPISPSFRARTTDISYFGHIRPNKGLETFLEVIAEVRAIAPQTRISVIGEIPAGYEGFGQMVIRRCGELGVDLRLGLDDAAVANALADVRLLYLPFPDGVSARRGSALAGFANGAILATRVGNATPPALATAIVSCSGLASDAARLHDALRMSNDAAESLQAAGRHYIEKTLPHDWTDIAMRYDAAITDSFRQDAFMANHVDDGDRFIP